MLNFIKNIITCFLLLNIIVMLNAYPHGSDKPGPNGGHILMPGSFHTELVINKTNPSKQFIVFLLDSSLKNPITNNSSIQVTLRLQNDSSVDIPCVAQDGDHNFLCSLPRDLSILKSKEILVKPVRNGVSASNAIYKLPLVFKTIK